MYVTFDSDAWSDTFGQYCVRDGCMSYDGFETEEHAYAFIDSLLNKD